MSLGTAQRIEWVMDACAAGLLAAAIGFALSTTTGGQGAAGAGGLVGGAISLFGLRRISPVVERGTAPAAGVETPVNALLAEADRSIAHAEDELVLDDILAKLDPDSRVVRLFERQSISNAGGDHGQPVAGQNASEALHQALADLRRSLN